jgi:hypothetical protein
MPVPCRISIDAGTSLTIATSATLLVQGTNSASKPIRLKRIQLQSNQTGSTQQTVNIQLVTYATASSTGGTTPTAAPVDDALVGVYTPATAFRVNTTTLGTTPTSKAMWYWNTANPFDIVEGMVELQDEFAVSKVWALVIPTAPATSFSCTGTINFEEFG